MSAARLKVPLLALAWLLATATAFGADFGDGFDDGALDPKLWGTPPLTEQGGVLTEANGRLELTSGAIAAGAFANADLVSRVLASRSGDWSISIGAFVDGPQSQFPGLTSPDVVVFGLEVEPYGETGDLDRAEINFALADLSVFGAGPGWDHGVRFAGREGGVQDETMVGVSDTGPLLATLRLDFDASAGTISGSYDVGSGPVPIGNPVDTGAWSMGPDEPMVIRLTLGAGTPEGMPGPGGFGVESGQLWADDFVASGSVFVAGPIPIHVAVPIAFIVLVAIWLSHRRVRHAARL